MCKMITSTITALKQDDCYLLIQRANNNFNAGKWEFPGGKVDNPHNLTKEALRELHEEVLGKYRVKNFHRLFEFSIKAMSERCQGYTIRFVVFFGELDIQLVAVEYEDRLKFSSEHQAIALLKAFEIEHFDITTETKTVLKYLAQRTPG